MEIKSGMFLKNYLCTYAKKSRVLTGKTSMYSCLMEKQGNNGNKIFLKAVCSCLHGELLSLNIKNETKRKLNITAILPNIWFLVMELKSGLPKLLKYILRET